jgi:hypothetical protein
MAHQAEVNFTSLSCNIRKKLFQIGTGKTYAKSSVPRFYWRMN